jgi:hypothetical protein
LGEEKLINQNQGACLGTGKPPMEKNVNLKFKSTEGFQSYQGKVGNFQDDESKDIPDNIAKELLSSFPENFFKVEGEKSVAPKHDKAMKIKQDK